MEEWIQTLDIPFESSVAENTKNQLGKCLDSSEGVKSWRWEEDKMEIFFNPYEITEEAIKQKIECNGLMLHPVSSVKPRGWKAFLKRLEKNNKKKFGDKRLDCCGLND